ncbi:MAG: CotH kinase family protein [Fibrobacter sp.]|jgi:hypothetical protein|nr:CotH kinase family protein [Fibrobacter sp.]
MTFSFLKWKCVFSGLALGLLACDSGSPKRVEVADPGMPYAGNPPVIFTEVDPANGYFDDHDGDDPAWVELFNPADTAVNLAGLSLTNTHSAPRNFVFGNAVVPPLGFLVVFLSGKNLPDYVVPSDSIPMIGNSSWGWADEDNDPPGASTVAPLAFAPRYHIHTDTESAFSAQMQLGDHSIIGWADANVFIAMNSGNSADVTDISESDELLLRGILSKGVNLKVQITQTGLDDWKSWAATIQGTGDTATYSIRLPKGTTHPDLKNIYGSRFSPAQGEVQPIQFTFTTYVARKRGHEPHASFKPSKKGGTLFLTSQDGAILDSVKYPELPPAKTWAFDGATRKWGYTDPTPAGYNVGQIFPETLPPVATLPASGFKTEPFLLEIPVPEGATVRYELGGKVPTAESPVYSAPIPVAATTVIRLAHFRDGYLPGAVSTYTYVFGAPPTLASVFVAGDPGSLFDPDTGLYATGPNAEAEMPYYGANYWRDTELPVHVELFEPGKTAAGFSENAGLEIFGNYSRMHPKKSVAITFKENYGNNRLYYPLLPEFPNLTEFKVFILRNNGNNYDLEYIRDLLASSVSQGLGVDYQKGRPVIVYYNGEYYGIHYIRERSTESYFETNYGLNPDFIDLLKADNSASNGTAGDYLQMINWIKANGVETSDKYQYISSLMDVNNFLNYMHTEIFADNRDWPANNLKKWKSSNPDTPWKWFLYDLDFGFGYPWNEYTDNIFEFVTNETGEDWPNGPDHTFLLRALLKNEDFRLAFINRYTALLSMNFAPERVLTRIDRMMAEIEAEIPRDQSRWGFSATYMNNQLALTIDFANTRQAKTLAELQEHFGLGTVKAVTIARKGNGLVTVHNLPLDASPMTVQFFEGTPVTVAAYTQAGSTFVRWSDGETSPVRVFDPAVLDTLTAEFK